MTSFREIWERLWPHVNPAREEGQGMVEYALILVLIAIVVIAVLLVLGTQVVNVFSDIVTGLGA